MEIIGILFNIITKNMDTKKIDILIERGRDGYSAWSTNIDFIYGQGDTIDDVKKSIEDAILFLKENNSDDDIPNILKGDYELNFLNEDFVNCHFRNR